MHACIHDCSFLCKISDSKIRELFTHHAWLNDAFGKILKKRPKYQQNATNRKSKGKTVTQGGAEEGWKRGQRIEQGKGMQRPESPVNPNSDVKSFWSKDRFRSHMHTNRTPKPLSNFFELEKVGETVFWKSYLPLSTGCRWDGSVLDKTVIVNCTWDDVNIGNRSEFRTNSTHWSWDRKHAYAKPGNHTLRTSCLF